MKPVPLDAIRDIIQDDVGDRGLRKDPVDNLVTACPEDFSDTCTSLAETKDLAVAIVTGFFIPHAKPPAGETDGPLGALFLAKVLVALGAKVVLVSDRFCEDALRAGLAVTGLAQSVAFIVLPAPDQCARLSPASYWAKFSAQAGRLTHLVAIERAGPSHTVESLKHQTHGNEGIEKDFKREVPCDHRDRYQTMKGRDITASMSPAHWLFEMASEQKNGVTTVGIGDGGNEIGMGKVSWDTIRRNISGGASIACRVSTDYLIVCGVSNWAGYGLAGGVFMLKDRTLDSELFDPQREEVVLQVMVDRGPLVDGLTGLPTATVDGLSFARYIEPLRKMRALTR